MLNILWIPTHPLGTMNICTKLPQQNLRQFNFNTVEAEENNSTVATSSKHWKWQPVDETFTQEEFNIKKQIFEGAKAKDKDFSGNTGRPTWENKNLTNIVADGFALMRSVMSRCWYAAPSHYLPHSQTSNQFFGHFNLENDKHDIHLHSSKILDSSLHTESLTTKTIKTSTCSAEPQSSTLCGSGGLIRNTVDGLWGHRLPPFCSDKKTLVVTGESMGESCHWHQFKNSREIYLINLIGI